MHSIDAVVLVSLIWDDDANEWTADPHEGSAPLEWCDSAPPTQFRSDAPDGALDRAISRRVTAEDLAHMLGSALTQAGPNKNLQAGYRPASNGLVHMIEAAIDDAFQAAPHRQKDVLVQQLVPIFASVDQNAHLRGRAEASE